MKRLNQISPRIFPPLDAKGATMNQSINRAAILAMALRNLEAFVRELSEQSDTNALDILERLRKGHIERYEHAKAVLTGNSDHSAVTNCPYCGAKPSQSHDPQCGLGP